MKTTHRNLVLLFICATAVTIAVGAQAQDCPENEVTNGGFENGLDDWLAFSITPIYDPGPGCNTDGFVQMWGNQTLGQSIKQDLDGIGIEAGKTYRISVCYRFVDDYGQQDHVRFRLSASVAEPNNNHYPSSHPGDYEEIGVTPNTSSTGWTTYTFPLWTATEDASWIAVNPENDFTQHDLDYVSWGEIDDICIEKVPSVDPPMDGIPELEVYTEPLDDYDPLYTYQWTWDFDDGSGGVSWDNWTHVVRSVPEPGVYVGDYSQLYSGLDSFDPCCFNYTGQVVFLDDGYVIPQTETTTTNWNYGPNSFILNNSGGLTGNGDNQLNNEIRSPAILLPNPVGMSGAELSFDVYRHEPLDVDTAGMMYYWQVRSAPTAEDLAIAEWRDWDVQYYGEPACMTHRADITDLLDCDANYVQIALGVIESGGLWGYTGSDGTPAPYFDNVKLETYDLYGMPVLRAREIDLLQDNFPEINSLDPNSLENNHISLVTARNICLPNEECNTPGDNLIFFVGPCPPPTVTLHYKIEPNDSFPASIRDLDMEGTILGEQIGTSTSFSVEFPDGEFFYPGDVMHYYLEASGVTLPDDPLGSGYEDFSDSSPYPATYTVRGLPSHRKNVSGEWEQPRILFWNDFGNQEELNGWIFAMNSLGYELGHDYDVYTTNSPSAGMGNGLGGRSNSDQLTGYDTILYSAGELAAYTVSKQNYSRDAGDDLGVLMRWMDQGGKNLFLTGGNVIYDLATNNGDWGTDFLADYLGVTLIQQDIRPPTGQQHSLIVRPTLPVFAGLDDWAICGIGDCSCAGYAVNAIESTLGIPRRAAEFLDPSGEPNAYTFAAATHLTIFGSQSIVMPYDLNQVHFRHKTLAPLTVGAKILGKVLTAFGSPPPGGNSYQADLDNSTAVRLDGNYPVSVCNFPNGKGDSFQVAHDLSGGWYADCTITLTLIDQDNQPIVGYPREDLWLEVVPDPQMDTFTKCCLPCGWIADRDTDANGVTTFTGPYNGGGTMYPTGSGLVHVSIGGQHLTSSPGFPIYFNSPDINGDCRVDLLDLQDFALDYFGPYNYRSDFYADEEMNLLDIPNMANAMGISCPNPPNKSQGTDTSADPVAERPEGVVGLYADRLASRNNLSIAPNQPFEMHLLLTEAGDIQDLRGWEVQVQVPKNIRVLEWTLAGQALNINEAPEFMVGLGEPLSTEGPVLLATARCLALDDQPALFQLGPAGDPSASSNVMTVAAGSELEATRLFAVETASGDPAAPVFGVNASDEMTSMQPLPEHFALHSCIPNPFNPQTTIRFDVPRPGHVELVIYAVDGREVARLLSEFKPAGAHELVWRGEDDNGRRMASGVYFCKMSASGFHQTQRMVLLK